MKMRFALILALLFVGCSDPAQKAQKQLSERAEDSLRIEIRATKARIDSLNGETTKLRKTLDSLNIPSQT